MGTENLLLGCWKAGFAALGRIFEDFLSLMSLETTLSKIDSLHREIASHGDLPMDTLRRIQYRFRLDWNYHSNTMEGNTLTREETRSIMIGNVTVHGKPVRDVLEMRGHDETIHEILRMGKGEVRLSKKRIQEIHKAIMHEDDPEKRNLIGSWKKNDNHVINHRQEKFDFTSWADVDEEVLKLVNWVNAELDKVKAKKGDALHPAIISFRFHLRYLTIHPFYDGNGRTARILMNLLLISQGFPPVIITKEEKGTYGSYLAEVQAYGAPEDVYLQHMCGLLIRSQETVLRGIKGEPEEDADLLDKELYQFKLKFAGTDNDVEPGMVFGVETLICISHWLVDLEKHHWIKLSQLGNLFVHHNLYVHFRPIGLNWGQNDRPKSLDQLEKHIRSHHLPSKDSIFVIYDSQGFKPAGVNAFDCNNHIAIAFGKFSYDVIVPSLPPAEGNAPTVLRKLYSQSPTQEELNSLVHVFVSSILQCIEYKSQQLGLLKD